MKDRILELLRQESGYLSGQEMSTLLGVSRAAVWKAVEALRKEGYTIDSAPNRGYHLDAPTRPSFRPGKLLPGWTATLGRSWCRFWILSTPPTTWPKPWPLRGRRQARSLWPTARLEAAAGWVEALSPPQGWEYTCQSFSGPEAPAGGADAPDLRRGRGALRRDRSCLRPASGIKWTNDLVSGGRKLCGILTELSLEAESGHVQYAVVGAASTATRLSPIFHRRFGIWQAPCLC